MSTRVACFAMSMAQKFRALRQVGNELVSAGAEVRFWTDAAFRRDVQAIGASFVDLFDPVSFEEVDDASRPISSRNVTFAAERGAAVAEAAREWGADLVVYDSFTLIGEVVARRLGLPWVPVVSGHLMDSVTMRRRTSAEARTATDPRCTAAAVKLAREFGMTGASPFSYYADASPWLNVTCEPEEWVDATVAQRYQPLACFGKLSATGLAPVAGRSIQTQRLRIYAAFGTIIWWYWASQGASALEAIAQAARDVGADLVVGLGGGSIPSASRDRLTALGATVEDFADQATELRRADIFITHGGASSVHEAIGASVPMLTLPFFSDQPVLSARCKALGIAFPLIKGLGRDDVPDAGAIRLMIEDVQAHRPQMLEALAKARAWEVRALESRPAIARRTLALAQQAADGR
ncbi:MAG TPA: glycosyltransferase [Devosia sp.]|nr:glycosyltransferase [Devosia sp.]